MRLLIAIFSFWAAVPAFAKNHPSALVHNIETLASSQCFFIPPEGWEIADPSSLSSTVKIAFLKSGAKGFCPSINLAIEETDVSLNDYLKAVKAIHEQDRNTQWRALGKVRTGAGLAQLTEINATNEWGPVRILQLILMKEGKAFVLTAAALKEEMSNYYKDIQSAFRSLTLSNDLLGHIPQLERREMLKQRQNQLMVAAKEWISSPEKKNLFEDKSFQEKQWMPFQSAVLDNFSDMGAFWQILVLRSAHEKLLALKIDPAKHNIDQDER